MRRATRRSAEPSAPRARGPFLGAALAALGLSIAERYRQQPTPVATPEPAEQPEVAEPPKRPRARRRVGFVTAPVVLAVSAAVLAAGVAHSALGTITTIAGTGATSSTGDGGLGTAATVNSPRSVAVGPDGDVYIAEGGANKIRRIDKATGLMSTFAGTGSSGSTGDGGPATDATFNGLQGIDVALDGTVYAVETGGGRVRKITPGGTISTLVGASGAGYTGDGGPAADARLLAPYGVAVAADGSVLIADYGNHAVRKVNTSGVISTVAGTGSSGYSGNGGQATAAQIRNPTAVEPTPDGGFYIAEYHRVRYVNASGVISPVAGTGSGGFSGDGGPATSAAINTPTGLAIGTTGTIYISDTNNNRIRGIDTGGTINTTVGTGAASSTGDGGQAAASTINSPRNIAVTSAGIFIAEGGGNRVRLVEGYGVAAPTVSAVSPVGPANNNAPKVTGTAPAGSSVKLYTNATCTSAVVGSGTAADFAGTGITATVANDSTTALYATATDAFNSASACSATSVSYTEDSTPPPVPTITAGPSGATANPSPSWTFTTSGGTIQCRLLEGATELATWSACTTSYSPNLGARLDGPFTFEVRAIDSAQNANTTSRTITLDRSAPLAPVLTTDPGTATNDITPTWAWTAEASTALTCRIDKGATEIANWDTCASPKTYDLSGKGDGDYTFSVRATDAASNPGAIRTHTMTLDTVAPSAPAITGAPSADGSDTTPTWTFGDVGGATVECEISRGATVVDAWASCASTKTYTLSQDGTYTFAVRARDAAGNFTSSTGTYRLDTATPATPTITSNPPSSGSGTSPSWSFTGDGTGIYECQAVVGSVDPAAWSTCSSPYIASLGAGSDGTYTFYVRAKDAALNTSGIATGSTYTLDRDPPAQPVLTVEPGDATNDVTPTWEFTAVGTTGALCRIDKGATEIADWGSCVSPKTYDLSGKGDGEYTFSVRGLDGASNQGAIKTDTFTLDTAAPAAPAFSATPADDSNDETPSWSFGAVSGATLTCRLARGTTEIVAWTGCTTSFTRDLTGDDDGTYTLSVRATDAAGNVTTATDAFRLDTAAPGAPTIATEPLPAGNATSPSWAFTGEDGATFECRLMKGTATVSGWGTCTSARTYALGSETDGVFTFSVRAKDAAGNVGDDTTRTYELDRVDPAAPSFSATPPAAGSSTGPSWSFPTAAGTTVQCQLARAGTVLESWGTCTSPRTLSLSSDGDYTLSIRARDAAGNVSAETAGSYELDRAAPAAPSITASPLPVGAGTSPSWQFTGESGATLQCRVVTGTGPTVISDWATCTSPKSYDLSGESDALYTFAVRARDAAGNTSAEASGTYRLDREAPRIDAAPPASGNSREPSWSFSATNAASLQCRLERAGVLVEDWATCESPKAWNLAGRDDGTYTFSVRALDAGNETSSAVTGTYLLDTAAPGTPAFGQAPAGVGTGTGPRWAWTGDAGATFECRIERDGTADGPWSACASPRTLDLAARADGRYTLAVRGVDAVGNRGTAATGAYILDRAAPPAPTYVTAPAAASSSPSAAWGFVSEPGVAYECQLERDGAVVEAFAACASPRGYDLAGLADGAYVIAVRATDGAGNSSASRSAPFVLDRAGPEGVKLLTTPGAIGNDRTPTWAFALEGAAAFECTLRFGAEDVIAPGTCAGPQTYELQAGKDGRYVFRVRGFDAVGNPGAEIEDGYELDTADPKAPEIAGEAERTGHDPSPAWRFTAEAGAVLECQLKRGDDVVARMDECASPKDYRLEERGEGTYTFGVRATDAAGNTGELATATYEYERAEVKRKDDSPKAADPTPAASAPEAQTAAAPPAPTTAPPAAESEERAERAERAAKARARRRAAAAAERRAAQRAAEAARTAPVIQAKPKKRKSAKKKAAEKIAEVGKVMAQAAGVAAEKTAFPVLLLGLCGLFLVAQDRVDRRDPKLAMAPIFADPEMEFVPRSQLAADDVEQEPEP